MSEGSRERYQSLVLLVLLCITLFALIAYVAQQHEPMQFVIADEGPLPSLIDIQQRLNEMEPNDPIEVDGIYGPATQEKWERVWMNEQAKKYIEGTEE